MKSKLLLLTAVLGLSIASVVFAQDAMKADAPAAPEAAAMANAEAPMAAAAEEAKETAGEEMKEAVNAEAAVPAEKPAAPSGY